jgi:enolase-phosphatase E1
MNPCQFHDISHLLLDIEGTTCPVSFVAEVLFPYARNKLEHYLQHHQHEAGVASLIEQLEQQWQQDPDPQAAQLLRNRNTTSPFAIPAKAVLPYLYFLIDNDRKLTALKDLQGKIWAEGYSRAELRGPIFADVPAALRQWKNSGLVLAVYSSGSIPAQQLIYGYSNAGDLRPLFQHWFDTHTGPKDSAESYRSISKRMASDPATILFISDSLKELEAADRAGLQVLFSDREGNPQRASGGYPSTSQFNAIQLNRPEPGANQEPQT